MDGDSYQRVGEVLRGSVDRLSEINKTHEAEGVYNEQKKANMFEQNSHVYETALEDEMTYGL